MNEQIAIERLVREVQRYASGRSRDVERGAETPRLAALLLQKYGLGESPRAADPILYALDAETERIDPEWRENHRLRWAARPADIAIHSD
jgi:hypothetical protein